MSRVLKTWATAWCVWVLLRVDPWLSDVYSRLRHAQNQSNPPG